MDDSCQFISHILMGIIAAIVGWSIATAFNWYSQKAGIAEYADGNCKWKKAHDIYTEEMRDSGLKLSQAADVLTEIKWLQHGIEALWRILISLLKWLDLKSE